MTAKYTNFDTTTQGNREVIVAEPISEQDEPVRLDTSLNETDDPDATWTEVVGQLIQYDIAGALSLEEGKGTMAREEAIKGLLESEDQSVPITSEDQAHAVVDYFIDEDVLAEDGNDIVVLEDPSMLQNIGSEEADINTKMLLNWVSAIDGCTRKIDETIEAVETAQADLQDEIGETNEAEKIQEFEEKQEEVAQQLMNLTNGGNLDREDLGAADQAEYDRLEDRLFHLDTMKEAVKGGGLEQQLRKTAADLGAQMDKLEDIKKALETQKTRVKQAYKYEDEISADEAMEMAKNLGNIATSLTNVPTTEERKKEQDTMELAQQMVDATEDIDQDDFEAEESDNRDDEYEYGG